MNLDHLPRLSKLLAEEFPVHLLRGPEAANAVLRRWQERQRFWHGLGHLAALIDEIRATATGEDRDVLLLAALYHDAIYDPKAADNEEASARLLREDALNPHAPVIVRAARIIEASKWQEEPDDALTRHFFEMDTWQLAAECPLRERLAYERAIFREYQFALWETYRAKRAEFLRGWAERFPRHKKGVVECLELLAALQPRVALYPGSFHPFHLGHLSILRQAEAAFDKVIIGLGINRQKAGAADTLNHRLDDLQSRLCYHEVAVVPGLVTRFIDELPMPVTVVRGVRDGTDLEAELRYARFLNELRPGTNVVWIGCEPDLQHLSSSSIRELEAIEPGAGARYVPEAARIYGA